MRCPACHTDLVRDAHNGSPMVKTRGLLIKAGRLCLICPSCKGDVEATPAVMKSLQVVTALFFSPPLAGKAVVTQR